MSEVLQPRPQKPGAHYPGLAVVVVGLLTLGSTLVGCKSCGSLGSPTLTAEGTPTRTPPRVEPTAATATQAVPSSGEGVAPGLDMKKFGCQKQEECASTCDSGCVSIGFAENHQDTCQNIRAFDCSCVSNVCYTDGRPPRQ